MEDKMLINKPKNIKANIEKRFLLKKFKELNQQKYGIEALGLFGEHLS
jgi:hypothetical protein